jgi:hypothetical protein
MLSMSFRRFWDKFLLRDFSLGSPVKWTGASIVRPVDFLEGTLTSSKLGIFTSSSIKLPYSSESDLDL